MKTNIIKKALSFIAAAFIATAASDAQAVTFLWNNTGSQWTSGTSWTNGVAPTLTSSSTTTDEVQFSNYGANNNTVDVTSNRSLKTFTFLTNANAYTFGTTSAKYFEISGGLTNNSTATQTFNLVVYNANNSNTWTQNAGGTMVFNNTVNLTTAASGIGRTLTLAGGGTFTFNSSLNQGGTATTGKVVINNAGGTVNLTSANALGSGMVITAGQVNFSNAGSLGTGIVELGATTGTVYGNSILNNNKGSAIVLTGITGVLWTGTSPAGIQIGTSASTAANNIDFGSGLVTTTTSRAMNIAGTGVTIAMGTLTTTGTSNGYTYTFDGVGNTMDLDGWRISTAATPTQNVTHQLKGTANLTMGTIENGTAGWVNGIEVNGSGVNRFTGNNTYTGTTAYLNGTNIISGNNSAATGAVSIAGASGSGRLPYVRLDNVNGISSNSVITGSTSTATVGTIDVNAATAYVFNAYGGNNMIFTNSFGQASTITFTNAANIFTASSGNSGGRTLLNNSANLTVVFNGTMDIGSTTTALNDTFGGAGDWNVKGGVFNTAAGSVRGLNKTGAGKLTLEGASSYNGDTTISLGTLLVASGASITGSTVQLSGGLLDARGTIGDVNATGGTFDLRGTAGAFTLSTGTATVYSGGILGASTLTGGSLLNSGTVGDTTIATGSTLDVKTGGTASKATVNGGTLIVGGAVTQTILNTGTATVSAGGNAGVATINGSALNVYGTAGSTTINTGGTLNVKTGGVATGTASVAGGTLIVDGTAGTVVVNAGTATVATGGTIGSTTINGSLLSVNGSAGDVLVNTGGTLGGSGSVQGLTLNGGTVAPGNSPGLLTAYELNGSNGTFAFQLGAPTTRGITYDGIDVQTLLTLGSSTAFTFETLNSYTYVMGDVYDLFNFASINADAFDSAVLLAALPDLDTANSDLKWNVNNFTTDGIVNVIPEPSTASLLLGGAFSLIALRFMRRNKCNHHKHV